MGANHKTALTLKGFVSQYKWHPARYGNHVLNDYRTLIIWKGLRIQECGLVFVILLHPGDKYVYCHGAYDSWSRCVYYFCACDS